MKNKGFTLTELLAVIVILAIIALIATPIVMSAIENARKGAAERSIENIEHAAEVYYYNKKIDKGFNEIIFTCKNNECTNGDETLNINGTVPEQGTITINGDGIVELKGIQINGYSCYEDNNRYKCD